MGGLLCLLVGLGPDRHIKRWRLWTSDTFWQYISFQHALPPHPLQRASLTPSMTPPPACLPPPPPPPSHSSSPHCHCHVTNCHSSSPHQSRHDQFMCSNHALSGFSNHALLSVCSSYLRSILDNPVCSQSQITQCI